MPATHITYRDAREDLRFYFLSMEDSSKSSPPIFVSKSADSDLYKLLKTFFKAKDLTKEKYYLTTKDSKNISIDDLLKSKMIIFEKFEAEESKWARNIKEFNSAPYIPIVAFVEYKEKNNIDKIYDMGVDLVLQKTMFFSKKDKSKPDYDNATYFVQSINKLLLKSDILRWFCDVSKTIIKNMDEKYDSGIAVIENPIIKQRINQKLKIAFGHLRKPHTTYDSNYDFTNEEFVFLTYWSCLNEYIEEWLEGEYGAREKKLKNKYPIAKSKVGNLCSVFKSILIIDKTEDYSKLPEDLKKNYSVSGAIINSDLIKLIQKRFSTYGYFLTYDYNFDKSDGANNERYVKQPRLIIPSILLANEISDKDLKIRAKFYLLNQIRNQLAYTHADRRSILKGSLIVSRNNFQVYVDCVEMINMLYLLMNKEWDFIKDAEINHILSKTTRFINLVKKERSNKIVRFLGEIKKVNPNNLNDEALILLVKDESNSITEIRFKPGKLKSDVLAEFHDNDKVEVFANIDSGMVDGKYYQFLKIEDIIKID